MEFFVYDLAFLAIFIVFVVWFLIKNKEKLTRDGWMFLYRTRLGMKAIDYFGDKYKKILHIIKYFSIVTGFGLMVIMIYLLWKNLYIYISIPQITDIIKAPPIAPLIPYFPKLYGMENLFPPFYFAYFLIALAIVAVSHEFSHGVFMRLFKIKIKSTGFAFLGPFLGAFVEEDKDSFNKKSNLAQMSVLSAGAFANIITAVIFFVLLIAFFYASFQSGGYAFNTYSYSILPANETQISNMTKDNFTIISYNNKSYLLDNSMKKLTEKNASYFIAYDNGPAINSGLKGAITKINGMKINSQNDLKTFMQKSKPNQIVKIITSYNGIEQVYELKLEENPDNKSIGYIGIGFLSTQQSTGIISKFLMLINFKDPSTYYTPRYDGNFAYFIYYLLWWIALISALVGLFNMLPLGILDGGRFFYLSMLSLTKSEKFSDGAFKVVSALILFVFIFLTIIWFIRLI